MHACLKSFSQHIGQYSCRANHKILLDFISGPISYFELFFCCDWKPVFGLLILHATQLGCPDKLERKELPRLRVERRLTKTALFQHTCPCLSYYRADQLLVDKTIIWSDLPCLCWGKIVRRVVIITIVTTSLTITIAAESGWVEIWIWLQRISGDNIRAVGNVQLDGFSWLEDEMVSADLKMRRFQLIRRWEDLQWFSDQCTFRRLGLSGRRATIPAQQFQSSSEKFHPFWSFLRHSSRKHCLTEIWKVKAKPFGQQFLFRMQSFMMQP